MASSFEFAQNLVRAKDMQDVLRLQAEYIRRQMQALTEQAKELRREHKQSGKGRGHAKRLRGKAARYVIALTRKKAGITNTYCAAQYFCCIAPKLPLYLSHRTAVAFRSHDGGHEPPYQRHGSHLGADSCAAATSPSQKEPLHDRGHRRDHASPNPRRLRRRRSKCRNLSCRTSRFPGWKFRRRSARSPRRASRRRRKLREAEIRRRRGDGRARGHLCGRD